MHASVTTVQIQPGKMDEATRFIQGTLAETRHIQGLKGGYMFTDREMGTAVLIALWETEAAREAVSGRYQEILGGFAALLAGQPSPRKFYEVSVQL